MHQLLINIYIYGDGVDIFSKYRMAQLSAHIITKLMLCVSHPVANIFNEGLEIADALIFLQ